MLYDVVFYVCAPTLRRCHTEYLKELIEDFLESFLREFPNETLKPKFHFMFHYPDQIEQFGPLVHLQTLRFEAKHSYFKELAQRNKCKKNLCKSLATRHQFMQCVSQRQQSFLQSDKLDSCGGEMVPMVLLKNEIQNLLSPFLNGLIDVFQCNSIAFRGIKYIQNCFLVTGFRESLFQFLRIEHCYVINSVPYIIGKLMHTTGFSRHHYGFTVEEGNTYRIVKLDQIVDAQTLGKYKILDQDIVVMRYKVLFDDLT